MLEFIKKWSLVNAEMAHIFGGFCLCCLRYLHSRARSCPWTDYSDCVFFTYWIQTCIIQMLLKELFSLLQTRVWMAAKQCTEWATEQQEHRCKTETNLVCTRRPVSPTKSIRSTECPLAPWPGFTWTVTWSCIIIKHTGEHAGVGIISMGYMGETESLLICQFT